MFTRNYWLYQASEFVGNTVLSKGNDTTKPKFIHVGGTVGADVYSGKTYGCYEPNNSRIYSALKSVKFVDYNRILSTSGTYSETTKFNYCTLFGSGTTPPTMDDYKLEGTVATNCTCSHTIESTISEDGSEGTMTVTYTITNNNDAEITIGEIGIFLEMYWLTGYSTCTNYPYLVERTVLESPITIPAGGVGQVTYTIRMNYPVE